MAFFKDIENSEEEEIFPFNEDNLEEEEILEETDENINELEKIETKLKKGENIAISSLDLSVLRKSRVIYSCPRCKKIYWNNKWVKDTLTDIYSIRTELAYCNKCIGKTYENFVGSVEIYHKELPKYKDQIIELAHRVERSLEDTPPFEKILNISEKNDILFIFANTTRLALEIGKALRQEFQGGIQYEWFERNQYLRVKWYNEVDNRNYFKERIRALKDRRFGMFAFEDEE